MNYDTIEHPGKVQRIEKGKIFVTIQPQSACGSCHSKSYCGMAESADKIVEIPLSSHKENLLPGQTVQLTMKRSLGYRALMLGYLFPFILLMIALISLLSAGLSEPLAALASIGVLIPYYIVLYLKKNTIRSTFHFAIKK